MTIYFYIVSYTFKIKTILHVLIFQSYAMTYLFKVLMDTC